MGSNIRSKKCKVCKESFKPKYSSVQMVCSPKCAILYSKEKKQKQSEDLDRLRVETKKVQKVSQLIKMVAKICHQYIRLRDKDKPCVSCNTPYKGSFDAGHFYSAGKFKSLKFNENNIHGQCIQCNRYNHGNELEYSLNLPKRIGQENFNELKRIADEDKKLFKSYTIEELNEIREYYKKKIKELK